MAWVGASGSPLSFFGSKEARLSPGLIHFRGPFMRGCLYGATLFEFGWLAVYVAVQGCGGPWGLRVSVLAHHAVSVGVAHVLVSRLPPVDGSDAVATGLRAGDPAVPVVGAQSQCVRFWGGVGGCRDMLLLGVQRGVLQHGGIFPVWFGIAGSVTRKVKGVGSSEVIS